MTSAQIAQINGTFQSQSMQQMQYSGMVGPRPYSGESMAGSMANFGAAAAAPVAGLGLALAGLDPFSMAIKGGMSGYASGGVGGAMMGGMAMAAIPMAGMAAAGWGASQVYEGMQQQQALNSALRSSFKMRNQFGGSGFSSSAMGQIGQDMRSMQDQLGPGGERAGFEELTRLASNMGRMGMADGVRNAKDFSDKFKTMVSTLKTIATEMGTSLEEAQKMMHGMKSSGIFRQSEAAATAGKIRMSAAATGYAATEFTSMMGIGSQISRSIGGLGRAGAQGGLETLTNIGAAQRVGSITEDMIYNATGLTGAEGRQALATQQMSSSAKFLKSRRGRVMLAAIAGKDGVLDDEKAEALMYGGAGTAETLAAAQKNARDIGRPNFIRNEGRLRGAALEKFGGLADAIQMRDWMQQRGYDINTADDRTMLFAQRQLGMGRDEADAAFSMAKDLPKIMQERARSGLLENVGQKQDIRSKTIGAQGIKKKIDNAWDSITGSIKSVGAQAFTQMSEGIEGMINEMTDTYVSQSRDDIVKAFESAKLGGATGRAAMRTTFGLTGHGRQKFSGATFDPNGGAPAAGRLRGLFSNDAAKLSEFNRADRESFERFGAVGGDGKLSMKGIASIEREAAGMREGALNADATVMSPSERAAAAVRMSHAKGSGFDRVNSYMRDTDKLQSAGGKIAEFGRKLRATGSYEERAKLISQFEQGAGASLSDVVGRMTLEGRKGSYNLTGAHSAAELEEMTGSALSSGTGALGVAVNRALGAEAMSDKSRSLRARIIDNDAGVRNAAIAEAAVDLSKFSAKNADDLSVSEQGSKRLTELTLTAGLVGRVARSPAWAGMDELHRVDAIRKEMAKSGVRGMAAEQALAAYNNNGQVVTEEQRQATLKFHETYDPQARSRLSAAKAKGGIIEMADGKMSISSTLRDKLREKKSGLGADADMAEKFILSSMQSEADVLTGVGQGGVDSYLRASKEFAGMSEASQKKLVSIMGSQAGSSFIAAARGQEVSLAESFASGRRRGAKGGSGGVASLAGALGIGLDAKDKKKLRGMDTQEMVAFLESKAGLTGEDHIDNFAASIEAAKSGKGQGGVSVGQLAQRSMGSKSLEALHEKQALEKADPSGILGKQLAAQEKTAGLVDKLIKVTAAGNSRSAKALEALNKPEDKNQSGG